MRKQNYRADIDGIRALAVLAVFVFHLKSEWLPGGFVGVDVFFVLSGYLITGIIFRETSENRFSFSRFYQRRIARIFPAFLCMCVATIIGCSLIYSPQDYASAGANLSAALLSVANLKLLFQGSYFEISQDAQPYLHCWSLSVEEQFYLVFPLVVFVISKTQRSVLHPFLLWVTILSFLACSLLTLYRPVWAFYLLPTRAWELGVGALLAVSLKEVPKSRFALPAGFAGLALVLSSFVFLQEGEHFPGVLAFVPVFGTYLLLVAGQAKTSGVSLFLATPFLTWLGKLSYSLYLWHWPVFSLVDYQCILWPGWGRLTLKVALSFFLAVASFRLIEAPARTALNRHSLRSLGYGMAVLLLPLLALAGVWIRHENYVNASAENVTKGGLSFEGTHSEKSVVLMGDSNASMYGRLVKEICADLDYPLNVISVAAGDPLPNLGEEDGELWKSSLAYIRHKQPAVLLLACAWDGKLAGQQDRLDVALKALKPWVGRIVVLNQPPVLPPTATRQAIREGARPPFFEREKVRDKRKATNQSLYKRAKEGIDVVDVASAFERASGEVLFLDEKGHQLYHDGTHLSGHGADLVEKRVRAAIIGDY